MMVSSMSSQHDYIPVERYVGADGKGNEHTSTVLPEVAGLPATPHRYEEMDLHAINVARAAGRPLLVRGEPGTGKSQLARAAALLLDRQYVWKVADAQTKITDLFYDFDAVGRLAQAQVMGALCAANVVEPTRVMTLLNERSFVTPGPLWWAFDAAEARRWITDGKGSRSELDGPSGDHEGSVGEATPEVDDRPYVVLIDELDKTDPSVPNGLLEALGQGTFQVLRKTKVSLHAKDELAPLVVITTNDERELPPAFVRRCMVHHIRVPRGENALVDWLTVRGRTHFGRALSDTLLARAARLVHVHREHARRLGLPRPGQAEYLDLLRAVGKLREDDGQRLALLEEISVLALKKHPDLLEQESRGGGG